MKRILILLILGLSIHAEAAFWLAGHWGARYERDVSLGEQKTRTVWGGLAGYRFEKLTGVFEFSTFTDKSGNSTLNISRTQYLYLLTGRLHPFDEEKIFSWYPYFSGGIGAYYEKVETQFLGISDERTSIWNPALGLGVGVFGNVYGGVRLGPEFRILWAKDFDPQFMPDLGLRVGFEF